MNTFARHYGKVMMFSTVVSWVAVATSPRYRQYLKARNQLFRTMRLQKKPALTPSLMLLRASLYAKAKVAGLSDDDLKNLDDMMGKISGIAAMARAASNA